ncbi:MAG: DNA methyltransferase [Promethearchaeota archaeon]
MVRKGATIQTAIDRDSTRINKSGRPVGGYDPRNTLNDLGGTEWLKFLKSWFVFDALQTDLREERAVTKDCDQHPATFSPTLVAEWINFFTKRGVTVLDPFLGIGNTLVACDRTGRKGYGIEINPQFAEISKKRITKSQTVFIADARRLNELNIPPIDFCITSPPYWSMLRKIDVNQKIRIKKNLQTDYGDLEGDLGTISDYQDFLRELVSIFYKVYDVMKDKAYLAIIVQNVVEKSRMTPFAWELAIKLSRRFVLKKEKIWCQDHKNLHPFGYPYAYVTNTHHHYCLVFRKED